MRLILRHRDDHQVKPPKLPPPKNGAKTLANNMTSHAPKAATKDSARPRNGKPPAQPIEEKLLRIPHLASLVSAPMGPKAPLIYTRYIEDYAPKLSLPVSSLHILRAFANIDVTAMKIAQALKANSYYLHYFRRACEVRAKREHIPSVEAAVVLLGMQNSRNLVIALQAYRTVKGKHPELDEKGNPVVSVDKLLKYAIKTEELLAGDRSGYADVAYAAGLIFDLLALISEDLGDRKAKIQSYIAQTYLHGLRTAKIASELVESMPEFSFRKYLFSSCLIHDVGKVLMAIIEPEYLSWLEEVRKNNLPRNLRHFSETLRFGINHTDIGALVCHSFKFFRQVEKAVLQHHDPYRARSNKNLHDLACLISVSSNMANQFRKISSVDDPMIAHWIGHELRGFKISPRAIVGTSQRISI